MNWNAIRLRHMAYMKENRRLLGTVLSSVWTFHDPEPIAKTYATQLAHHARIVQALNEAFEDGLSLDKNVQRAYIATEK